MRVSRFQMLFWLSSSSSARALPCAAAKSISPQAAPQASCFNRCPRKSCDERRFVVVEAIMAIPLNARPNGQARTPRPALWPGSGRFCGAIPHQGFIQKARYAGNNGRVRQVENVGKTHAAQPGGEQDEI